MIHFARALGFGNLASLAGADSLFADAARDKLERLQSELEALSKRYDIVVANPPYMGSSSLGKWMGAWVKNGFPEAYRDLCTSFIMRGFSLAQDQGYSAMVTMQSWMFLGSFEKMRGAILRNHSISSMAHLGTRAFGAIAGEVVSTTATVFANAKNSVSGTYLRLVDMQSEETKREGALEALADPNCGWLYRCTADSFEKVPGSPIAYWISSSMLRAFKEFAPMAETASPKQGLATGDNELFIRQWWEVSIGRTGFGHPNRETAQASKRKWFPCNKGGGYRKWFGNNELVVNWENDGEAIKGLVRNGKKASRPQNMEWYFKEGMTWGTISSADLSMRYSPAGYLFETKGSMCFADNKDSLYYCLAFTNSSVVKAFQKILSPTLDFHEGPLGKLPLACGYEPEAIDLANQNVPLAKDDWDAFESSFDFKKHPLI